MDPRLVTFGTIFILSTIYYLFSFTKTYDRWANPEKYEDSAQSAASVQHE